MNLNEWAKEIHKNAVEHGFWNKERSFGETVALMHSELSEALEEDRADKPMEYFIRNLQEETDMTKWNGEKTEGVAVELADCLIRILDWCGKNDIDIEGIVERKHKYNQSRPYLHGKKY